MKHHCQAFTVVEFLIAIFIMGIMMTMLFRSYEQTRRHDEYYTATLLVQKELLLLTYYFYQLTSKAGLCDFVPISKVEVIGKVGVKHIQSYGLFNRQDNTVPLSIRRNMKPDSSGFYISYVEPLSRLASTLNSRYVRTKQPVTVKQQQPLVICHEGRLEFLSSSKSISHRQAFSLDKSTIKKYPAGSVLGIYQRVYVYLRRGSGVDALYFLFESGIKGEISRQWHQMNVRVISTKPHPILRLYLTNKEKQRFDLDMMLLNENKL